LKSPAYATAFATECCIRLGCTTHRVDRGDDENDDGDRNCWAYSTLKLINKVSSATMIGARTQLFAALAVLVAGAFGSGDFVEGIQHDFRMAAILPRQGNNLQAFQGALGGVRAAAVRSGLLPVDKNTDWNRRGRRC